MGITATDFGSETCFLEASPLAPSVEAFCLFAWLQDLGFQGCQCQESSTTFCCS